MNKPSFQNIVSAFLLLIPLLFNLYCLFPELKITHDVNDNVFAYALAVRMDEAWKDGGCPTLPAETLVKAAQQFNPISIYSCLTKITDHWVSNWAMGYPLPHYYQHLPSIINVALFRLVSSLHIIPQTTTPLQANSNFQHPTSISNFQPLYPARPRLAGRSEALSNLNQVPGLFSVFNLVKYLLLCLFPLSVYWCARKFGIPKIAAGFSALCSILISTNFQYGTDYNSIVWRGSGMHTQLWGMFFLPLALGSLYETITAYKNRRIGESVNQLVRKSENQKAPINQSSDPQIIRSSDHPILRFSDTPIHRVLLSFSDFLENTPHLLRTILFLTITFQSHIFFGYIAALSSIILLFVILIAQYLIINKEMINRKSSGSIKIPLIQRIIKSTSLLIKLIRYPLVNLILIYGVVFGLLAYWLIPLFMNDAYHAHSVWDELYKFNSFGAGEVINRYLAGEIFDYGRFPILAILVAIGFFYAIYETIQQFNLERLNSVYPVPHGTGAKTNLLRSNLTIKQYNDRSSKQSNPISNIQLLNPTSHLSSPTSYLLLPILLLFWTLMYFGRTTWGGLIDLLPGSEGIHMHRFINGIHFAAIFLAGLGLFWLTKKVQIILQLIKNIFVNFALTNYHKEGSSTKFSHNSENLPAAPISVYQRIDQQPSAKTTTAAYPIKSLWIYIKDYLNTALPNPKPYYLAVISHIIIPLLILFPAFSERYQFLKTNANLLTYYNRQYAKDWPDFQQTLTDLNQLEKNNRGRIWAGRPGNWGKNFKVGGQEVYLALAVNGFNTLGFEPESWSPNTDLEQFFNDQRADHYDLFNIKYIIAPAAARFPEFVTRYSIHGKYNLYQVKTGGDFAFINSPMTVYGDKYNTLNFTRAWLESDWPKVKLHPSLKYNNMYQNIINNYNLQITGWMDFKRATNRGHGESSLYLLNNNPFSVAPKDALTYPGTVQSPSAAKILSQSSASDVYTARVYTSSSGLLMLKATYHPFWDVTINGHPATKQMVFPYFIAVEVPQGQSAVIFTYQSQSFKNVLLLLGLIILIILVVVYIIKIMIDHKFADL